MIVELPYNSWTLPAVDNIAISSLEAGKILFLPNLAFTLSAAELSLLTPTLVQADKKNISFDATHNRLSGIADNRQQEEIHQLLKRYYNSCCQLIAGLLPDYQQSLHSPVTTLRLHPVGEWKKKSSWRKDDSRLHVDAFPSRPNHGERIMRIFSNINPDREARAWRVGESFTTLAPQFLPQLKPYSHWLSWLQHKIKITKRRRTHYDHIMLQLHNAMKADIVYQQQGKQQAINFPTGSSWICFSDQTPHAAMSGQYMLEQTFFLPISAMHDPQQSPLKILEALKKMALVW